jgi:bacterioferritin-associated ferredoxin
VTRARSLLLLLVLGGCSRTPATKDAPSSVASAPASAPTPAPAAARDAAAAVPRGPHASDAPLSWAFWTRAGAVVAASKTDLWKLDAACSPPRRVPLAIEALIAQNGADRFVVERGGAFELWDAEALRAVGPIAHPARGRGGAVSRDGARIALGGCKEIADDANLMTSCGELYDGATGQRSAGFVGKHQLESLAFSDDGKYLAARSGDHGFTVFDAATGKVIVTRPRWQHTQEVHGWNRPDVAEIVGDELVVVHGDTAEHVDLASGKTLGRLVTHDRTLSVFGRKTKRVAVFQGVAARAQIWDVASHAVVRTFELAKYVAAGANCGHCALEIDEVDEDRVWLISNYTDDRLSMRIGTGEVVRVDAHGERSESIPSATHRVEETYDNGARQAVCMLDRRDREAPAVALPVEYCNRTYGPTHRREGEWPYPGFDPSGRFLGSIHRSQLRVWDVERGATVCVAGASR